MKRFSLKNIAPLLFTLVIICLPLITVAENTTPYNPSSDRVTTPYNPAPACPPGELCNPLKAYNFCDLIKIVLQAILVIGLPIAVLFLVYVGFKFITAQGKPDKITEAQKNLLNTVIGIAIFLGAWTIAKVIAVTLQGLGASAVNECIN